MATKLDYLKKCITQRSGAGLPIENKDWYVICFTNPVLKKTEDWGTNHQLYDIVTQEDGLYFVDHDSNSEQILTKIEDFKKGEPLFKFQDDIEVDGTWLPSIEGKITTKIGRLVVNAMAFFPVVGERLPYVNKKFSQREIEALIIGKTKNQEDMTDSSISVPEMIECIDRLNFFMSISTFANVGATAKTITPPPGVEELKKKLIAEYGDELKNPVKFVEFERRLKELDKEYLEGDPGAGLFNGKSRTARAKMFLAYGNTLDFEEGEVPNTILPSLSEGIDNNPEDIAKAMNDLRYGSYSRGASTALSGYSYKVLQRSLSGLKVSKTPCSTTKGLKRLITERNYKKLVGRYIKDGKWILIENTDAAKAYVGKIVEFRSAMYCLASENTVCYACMGEGYKNSESGITNLAANISTVLMNLFLKLMHSVETVTTDIEIDDICS